MIVTLDEAKEFLHIDYDDEDKTIQIIITATEEFIDAAIDGTIDKKSAKVKTIQLFLISDMYDNRSFSCEKQNSSIRDIAKMMLLQL